MFHWLVFFLAPAPVSSEKSKKKKTKNSQKELTVKDIPPVHQKRALEILNEAQSKKTNKGGSVQKIDISAQKPTNEKPSNTSSSKAKAQSTAPAKAGKNTPKSVQNPVVVSKDAKTFNGVNRNKENVKVKKSEVLLSPSNSLRSPSSCDVGQVTLSHAGGSSQDRPVYRLSEVLNCIAHTPPAPREEIKLENLRLPPGITITKVSTELIRKCLLIFALFLD